MSNSVKYCSIVTGKTLKCDEHFLKSLHEQVPGLDKASEDECDVFLVFCPIVSRAGTDIEQALKKCEDKVDFHKLVVLVVIHYTFDPEKVVSDSSICVNREKTLTVDCLFDEDKGLLDCAKNKETIDKVVEQLKQLKSTSATSSKGLSNVDNETKTLLPEGNNAEQHVSEPCCSVKRCCCCLPCLFHAFRYCTFSNPEDV